MYSARVEIESLESEQTEDVRGLFGSKRFEKINNEKVLLSEKINKRL